MPSRAKWLNVIASTRLVDKEDREQKTEYRWQKTEKNGFREDSERTFVRIKEKHYEQVDSSKFYEDKYGGWCGDNNGRASFACSRRQ